MCKGIEEYGEIREARVEERYSKLIELLCKKQQFEELQKVASSAELRKQYYAQYGI